MERDEKETKTNKITKGSKTRYTTTNKRNASTKEKDLDECPICKMKWEDDRDEDWLECNCKQWLHEQCIDYDIRDPYLCPNCISN